MADQWVDDVKAYVPNADEKAIAESSAAAAKPASRLHRGVRR